jgi:hypothetical protein
MANDKWRWITPEEENEGWIESWGDATLTGTGSTVGVTFASVDVPDFATTTGLHVTLTPQAAVATPVSPANIATTGFTIVGPDASSAKVAWRCTGKVERL